MAILQDICAKYCIENNYVFFCFSFLNTKQPLFYNIVNNNQLFH